MSQLEKTVKVDGGQMPEVVVDMKKKVDAFRQKLEVSYLQLYYVLLLC